MWQDPPPAAIKQRRNAAIGATFFLLVFMPAFTISTFRPHHSPIFSGLLLPILVVNFYNIFVNEMGMPESLWRQKRIPNSQVGSLRLVRCGTEYEQDSGVLWAEPGVLHFEGVRTTIILPNGSPHIDSATFEGKGLFRIFLKDPKLPQIKIGCRTPTDGNEKFTAKDMFDVWRSQVGPEELTKLSPKDYPPELLDKKRTATAVAGFCFLAIYMIGLAAMQLRSEPTAFSYVIFALMCVVYAMLPWFWVTRYLKIRSIRHELGLE